MKNYPLIVTMMLLLLASCSEDDSVRENPIGKAMPISFVLQSDMQRNATRAITPTTDTKVFVSQTTGAVNPVEYSYSGSAWYSSTPLVWLTTSAFNVYAFSNSRNTGTLAFSTKNVTQESASPYFLAAKTTGVTYSESYAGLSMTLTQKLAKVTVTVSGKSKFLTAGILKGLKQIGHYQPDASADTDSQINSWTVDDTSTADITMYQNGLTLTAWIIPQQVAANTLQIVLTYNGKTFTYSLAAAKYLKAGYNYNFTLTPHDYVDPDVLQYGDIIYDDCDVVHLGGTKPTDGAKPVGVVVYKASSAEAVCEANAVVNSKTIVGKAIVMALWDCGSEKGTITAPYYQWGSEDYKHTDQITYGGNTVDLFPTGSTYESHKEDYYGYEKTYQMVVRPSGTSCKTQNHTHAGASAAYNYHTNELGSGYSTNYLYKSTGWFLPSIRQMWEIVFSVAANGNTSGQNTYTVNKETGTVNELTIPSISSGGIYIKEIATSLKSLIENAGGVMLTNETNWVGSQANCYQSSSHSHTSTNNAIYQQWSTTLGGIRWGNFNHTNTSHWRVRAVMCY